MHLLDIESLSTEQITELLKQAQSFITKGEHRSGQLQHLAGKTLFNLFFENSTRTRISFELAAKRLAATVVNVDLASSSVKKGESLLDTVDTLQAMGADFFVVRHSAVNTAKYIAEHVGDDLAVINAGDGHHAHPSQALLDMLTIQQHKPNFTELKVALVGDMAHSRVARSDLCALKKLGVNDIRVIAPSSLLPDEKTLDGLSCHDNLQQGLADVDVVMALRIQKERMLNEAIPDEAQFNRQFGITAETLQFAKPDAIVMHPGPLNRNVEINSDVADGPQSVILQQVENGVAMRMAVLAHHSRSTKN